MVRPCKKRNIWENPNFTCFKPTWTPRNKIEKIELMLDELESIRLADLEWNSHIKAAEIMWISASTFNRILSSARKKIAEALVIWKWLRIYKEDLKYNC
jgi:predicted DNA-binding protein (UPF0251 family)